MQTSIHASDSDSKGMLRLTFFATEDIGDTNERVVRPQSPHATRCTQQQQQPSAMQPQIKWKFLRRASENLALERISALESMEGGLTVWPVNSHVCEPVHGLLRALDEDLGV